MADPRWPALRAQLARTAAAAGCDWDRSLAGWMVWMPQDCRTLVWNGAQNRAIPNFMGLASLTQEIGISCDVLHSVLPLSAILGLYFSCCRPQVWNEVGQNLSAAAITPAARF